MKKLFLIFISLLVFYVGLQIIFKTFKKGHSVEYEITAGSTDFKINEKYYQRISGIDDHYDLVISNSKYSFDFSTYHNFGRNNMIVKDLYYYSDKKYACILPVFMDDKIVTDFMCLSKNTIYPYHTIIGKDSKLDKYVSSVEKYNVNNYLDDLSKTSQISSVKIYKNNFIDNQHIALNTYKGVLLVNNSEVQNINLFDNDVYKQKLLTVVGNKYVIANYNEKYDFNGIYIVDIKNGKKEFMKTYEISFDSYIQGVIDDSIYLIDISNKKQYEININLQTVDIIGTEKSGVKYYDGKNFINKSMIEALKNKEKFKNEFKSSNKKYTKIGNDKTAQYIYFKETSDGYDVYKSNALNKNLIYLFHVNNYSDVSFIKDYIYLTEDNNLIVYHDSFGKKTLINNSEMQFNDNLYFFEYHD